MVQQITLLPILVFFRCIFALDGQPVNHYNLVELLQKNKLEMTSDHQEVRVYKDPHYRAISARGFLWLSGVTFKEGIIDIDLKGRNRPQESFLGIAFHGTDTITFEAIYFRPFNFRATDTLKKKHAVEYISEPDFPWEKLRAEHPGIYENAVYPAPQPEEWFHATIVVDQDWIRVYVNHSSAISLKVKRLSNITDGKIGLWTWHDALSGDFANLTITNKVL